ncbi:MAG: hypothetical protein RL662_172 [Bacteroidota bacterium]|jgi:putative flippase GtrA
MKQSYKEAVKYGIVGVIGLGVEWGTFFIFRDVFGLNYITSHILGSMLAITNNFILNRYFTFKTTDKIWKRAFSFFGIAAIGLVVSTALLSLFVNILGFGTTLIDISISQKAIQNLAKLGATGIVTILQFFLNKYFTFKKQES